MEYLISQLINGLCQGSIYALIAIGYTVVVGITGMVTFAHGEVIMIGAFASFFLYSNIGNNILLGLLVSFAASWCMGILLYKICYERFFDVPRSISMICTIGFSTLVKNLAQIFFGPEKKPMLNIVENKLISFGPFQISVLQLTVIAIVIVLSTALALFFNKTTWGVALRAVSQERTAAYMVGINVKKMVRIGTCIGCGLGGIAGMLRSVYYQYLEATMGGPLGMKAFSSAVMGGMVDVRFSALGGLILGVIENLGISFSSASLRDIFAFVFLILLLLVKPEGFAKKKGKRP